MTTATREYYERGDDRDPAGFYTDNSSALSELGVEKSEKLIPPAA